MLLDVVLELRLNQSQLDIQAIPGQDRTGQDRTWQHLQLGSHGSLTLRVNAVWPRVRPLGDRRGPQLSAPQGLELNMNHPGQGYARTGQDRTGQDRQMPDHGGGPSHHLH